MIKIKGNMQMPKNMFDSVETVARYKKEKTKDAGYLGSFERNIDPVIIATFFGLYKSQELPPMDKEDIQLSNSHEFNADISDEARVLNHLIFCLWVKKNGTPDKCKDIMKYREDLYNVISKLINTDYHRDVLIPFYLDKADGQIPGTSSFLHRLAGSDNAALTLEDNCPEFLALEFKDAQDDFIKEVITPLGKKE